MTAEPEMRDERRVYRRLAIRLPVECRVRTPAGERCLKGVTTDISTGGVSFDVEDAGAVLGPLFDAPADITLTVPPGEGHFPYESRVHSVAQILRYDPLERTESSPPAKHHVVVAARFRQPLKLTL